MANNDKLLHDRLDYSVELFKSQMAKTKQNNKDDWKMAYLNGIDKRTNASINRDEQYRKTV